MPKVYNNKEQWKSGINILQYYKESLGPRKSHLVLRILQSYNFKEQFLNMQTFQSLLDPLQYDNAEYLIEHIKEIKTK